ncbi:PREDICTED: coiled-coil domain-containing protein 33 [Gekko japonicus]|uniref:Coiled-coil domain-containing protein 33 n=1 Tax=Gekko japonicus TaxID=146911 RepID=A0ABM1K237_GEKJA|nr:PREDICTED: coiled-coil domain-containing protein 33 [Gekko japonicus]
MATLPPSIRSGQFSQLGTDYRQMNRPSRPGTPMNAEGEPVPAAHTACVVVVVVAAATARNATDMANRNADALCTIRMSISRSARQTCSGEWDQLQKDENGFPSHDAVAGVLPDKQIYTRPVLQEVPDVETETFRTAIQRMADDILSLRRHVANLEAENSALRRNLTMHEDVGRVLLEDIDLDVMTRAEIVDRLLGLKQKLTSGAREMAKMKDRVQRLQNELIRKNDREKDLVMLQRAHQQQQIVLRKYQAKIAKMKVLEDAVRQQEKVIERMEKMLEEKMTDRFKDAVRGTEKYPVLGDGWSKDLYSTLMAENTRLREELNKTCYRSSPIILQQQALPDVFSSNSEKLTLLSKLEKAETRIHVLECQLEESARKWGREKQDYASRLLENERGFGPSPSSILLPEFPLAGLDSPSRFRMKTLYPSQ